MGGSRRFHVRSGVDLILTKRMISLYFIFFSAFYPLNSFLQFSFYNLILGRSDISSLSDLWPFRLGRHCLIGRFSIINGNVQV